MTLSNSTSGSTGTPKSPHLVPQRQRTTRTKSKSSIENIKEKKDTSEPPKRVTQKPIFVNISVDDLGEEKPTKKMYRTKSQVYERKDVKKELVRSNTSKEPLGNTRKSLTLLSKIIKPKEREEVVVDKKYPYYTIDKFKEWLGLGENKNIFLHQNDATSGQIIQDSIQHHDLLALYAGLQYGMMPAEPRKSKDSNINSTIKAFQIMHTLGYANLIADILPKLKSRKDIAKLGFKIDEKEIDAVHKVISHQFTDMTGVLFLLSLQISQYQKDNPCRLRVFDATQWLYVDSHKTSYFDKISSQRVSYTKIRMLQEAVTDYTGNEKCLADFMQVVKDTNESLSK